MPQITLPPRLRESDLPANAMSSAHKYDDRLEGDIDHADEVAHGDTLAYIA